MKIDCKVTEEGYVLFEIAWEVASNVLLFHIIVFCVDIYVLGLRLIERSQNKNL